VEKKLTSSDKFTVTEFPASRDGRWITFTGNTGDRFVDTLDRRGSEPYLRRCGESRPNRV